MARLPNVTREQLISRSKFVAIGIALVAMLVLTACGGEATATATPTDVPPSTSVPTPTSKPAATFIPVPTFTPKPSTPPTASPTPQSATSTPEPAASTPELQPLTNEVLVKFALYIEETRESFNVPGMAVVVVQGGQVAFAQGFGVKEVGGNDPITPDTLFSIGSTGKAMTAMMAATVVDDGLMAWETPVVEVMPQFQLSDADATGQITLRHLFAHTTGLPNIDLTYLFTGLTPEGIIESLKDVPLNTQPGESRTYQNEAFSVGGYVATMAAGGEYGDNLLETYIDMMQTRVFDPIGMSTATFSIEETEANPNHATPHYTTLNATLAETGFDVTPTHYVDLAAVAPAGSVRASAMDVGRFLMTMLADGVAPDGTRVVSAESLAETWNGQIDMNPDPWLDSVASTPGWTLADYQGIRVVTKDGALGGFIAQIAFVPGADTGIVVLTNIDFPVPSLSVQWRLVELLYGLEPKLEGIIGAGLGQLFAGLSDAYTQLLPVDLESVTAYLGEYESEVNQYTIQWRDGGLWFNWGALDIVQLLGSPEGGYLSISPNDFYLPFQFMEGEDGSITLVIAGFIEAPKIEAPKIGAAAGTVVSHGGPFTDYVSLVDNLRAAGAIVDPAGTISQPFFVPEGQLLTVNGEDVQAFEFASEVEADAIAETVSADGGSVGTSMISWVAPPHFYLAGRLIVVYVGSDSGVITMLEGIIGSQFAGR